MGLVGMLLSLAREPLRDDARSPADAQRQLWDNVDYCIRAMISSESPVLQNYLWTAASHGFSRLPTVSNRPPTDASRLPRRREPHVGQGRPVLSPACMSVEATQMRGPARIRRR